jgi:hypothetical protein
MRTGSLVPFGASSNSTWPNDEHPTNGIETAFIDRVALSAVDCPYTEVHPHITAVTAPVVARDNRHATPKVMDEGYYSVAAKQSTRAWHVQPDITHLR